MNNPLDELREKYWINVYHNDNPNAPLCNLVLVNKENKDDKYKYPVWKDKEKDGYGYVGKLDTFQAEPTSHDTAKQNAYQPKDQLKHKHPCT